MCTFYRLICALKTRGVVRTKGAEAKSVQFGWFSPDFQLLFQKVCLDGWAARTRSVGCIIFPHSSTLVRILLVLIPEFISNRLKYLGAQAVEDRVSPQPGNVGTGSAAGIYWILKVGCTPCSWKAILKGSCFQVQVLVHLARFLQPYQAKFVSLAEAKTGGHWWVLMTLLQRVFEVWRLECSMMQKGMKNVAALSITLSQQEGNTPWRALVCISLAIHLVCGGKVMQKAFLKKKGSCGFVMVGFQLVLPLDSG